MFQAWSGYEQGALGRSFRVQWTYAGCSGPELEESWGKGQPSSYMAIAETWQPELL